MDAALGWHHAVQERPEVAEEARALGRWALGRGPGDQVAGPLARPRGVGQNDALGAALWDVLVLVLLGQGEVVTLVEERGLVALVGLLVTREDQADSPPRDVAEAHVEAKEVSAVHEVDGVGRGRVERGGAVAQHDRGVQTESEGAGRLGLEEVREEDGRVEGEDHAEDLPVLGLPASRVDFLAELLVEKRRHLPRCYAAEVLEKLDADVQVALDELVDAFG
mmetsp:Transcript_30399/g.94299  ORF Transcript_30399/g.94299 Transcript_30399/m.94299 type:complete len:222 (-) Transcript_30399:428-1093(-)